MIRYDNKSAILIARNPIHHGWTKHIDTHYHFLRDLVKNEQMNLVHCGTNEQVADVFTKVLTHMKFEHFHGALGVCESSDHGERVEV